MLISFLIFLFDAVVVVSDGTLSFIPSPYHVINSFFWLTMHVVFNGLRCINKYVMWMMKIGAVDVACDNVLMMLVTIW